MPVTDRPKPVALLASGGAVVATYVAHLLVRASEAPGSPVRLAITAALLVSIATLLWSQVRLAAASDEFTRHVQFAALSIAFPISLAAAFAVGFLAGEGMLTGADPRDLPLIMVVAYAASLAAAWRRYS
jgi:hypothetical protein